MLGRHFSDDCQQTLSTTSCFPHKGHPDATGTHIILILCFGSTLSASMPPGSPAPPLGLHKPMHHELLQMPCLNTRRLLSRDALLGPGLHGVIRNIGLG